jgi:hypothetical protein
MQLCRRLAVACHTPPAKRGRDGGCIYMRPEIRLSIINVGRNLNLVACLLDFKIARQGNQAGNPKLGMGLGFTAKTA